MGELFKLGHKNCIKAIKIISLFFIFAFLTVFLIHNTSQCSVSICSQKSWGVPGEPRTFSSSTFRRCCQIHWWLLNRVFSSQVVWPWVERIFPWTGCMVSLVTVSRHRTAVLPLTGGNLEQDPMKNGFLLYIYLYIYSHTGNYEQSESWLCKKTAQLFRILRLLWPESLLPPLY